MIRKRMRGLGEAAAVVLSFATLAGFLGSLFWLLDLLAHFRVQYLLGALITATVLWFLGSRRFAAMAMTAAGINLALILPFYYASETPAPGEKPWTAMLLNVNTHSGSPARVAALLEERDPDFLVLEEVDSRWIEALSEATARYPFRVVSPRSDNFGIAFFSKFPLSEEEIVDLGEAEVPSILATVVSDRGTFQVCATHPLPPIGSDYAGMRDEQLALLPEVLSPTLPVLLVGDLNTTPWGHAFRRLRKTSGLLDSASGRGIQPSWPTGNPLLRIPIDHALHSAEIRIHDRRTGPKAGSDHFPLLLEFSVGTENPEP